MNGKQQIIKSLVQVGILKTSNPSTRDLANIIMRMYKNAVNELSRSGLHPNVIFDTARGQIEGGLGVNWDVDIAPILKVIGYSDQDLLELIP
ncbi:hypothetical protein [Treponema zioleckii]|uniref:hypothetical protein n=1 Tax=Treponema zioleckii TaxID=331680 RepID=UPI00168A4C79|nr:hypothetical protein [Treponema zioleckii]